MLRHIAKDEFLSDKDASFNAADGDVDLVITRIISSLSEMTTDE